jgi:suppressor of G2 allele of SKP1
LFTQLRILNARNEWYQTDNEIVVSVFIKNVDPATLSVEYTPASVGPPFQSYFTSHSCHCSQVSLSIKSSETAEIEFTLDPLAHAIDAELSSYNVGKVKVELKLKKKDMGVKWIKLEREAGEVEEGGLMR